MVPLRTLAICCSWQLTITTNRTKLWFGAQRHSITRYCAVARTRQTESKRCQSWLRDTHPVSNETRVPMLPPENSGRNPEGTRKIALPHEDSSEPQASNPCTCLKIRNKKTYLIIAHNRDALDKEIKSCALDHELDELNTGNALADRSSFGLQLCNSIQANDMEERCSFGIHIYNISRNTISFIYDSFTLHISKLSRNMSSFIWIWLHSLWSISDHQNA